MPTKDNLYKEISKMAKKELKILNTTDQSESIKTLNVNGSRKLSVDALIKMGKESLSKNEMNFYITLAKCQNEEGIAITNMHLMSSMTGFSPNYFMPLLHSLEKKNMIMAKRSVDVKESKEGVYIIDLLDNHFESGKYNEKPYIRLGHGICDTQEFFDLPPVSKFIILAALYNLKDKTQKDVLFWVNKQFGLNMRKLQEYALDWCGCSDRHFRWSLSRLVSTRFCNAQIGPNYENGRSILFYFSKEDLEFKNTDNFSYISHLINCALEEEGIHFTDDVEKKDYTQMAEIVCRNEKKINKLVNKAAGNYGIAVQNYEQNMIKSDSDKQKSMELAKEFQKIMRSLLECPTRFGKMNSDTIKAWANKPLKGKIMKDDSLPLWLRYIASKIVYAYKFLTSAIRIRNLKRNNFDLVGLIEKIIYFDSINKELSANEITSMLFDFSRLKKVQAQNG